VSAPVCTSPGSHFSKLSQDALDALFVHLCGVAEGYKLLLELGYVQELLQRWMDADSVRYVVDANARVTRNLVAANVWPKPAQSSASGGAGAGAGSPGVASPRTDASPTPIPVSVPADIAGGSLECGGFSMDGVLRLPWRIEIWADYQTEQSQPTNFANVSSKASKMLGLVSTPRMRSGSTSSTSGAGGAGGGGGGGAPSLGSFSEGAELTKHCVPIKCDAYIDASSIRCVCLCVRVCAGVCVCVCVRPHASWLTRLISCVDRAAAVGVVQAGDVVRSLRAGNARACARSGAERRWEPQTRARAAVRHAARRLVCR
jgi:hypothetical protein